MDMSSISPIETRMFAAASTSLVVIMWMRPCLAAILAQKMLPLPLWWVRRNLYSKRIKPVLELMGKSITLIGDNGAGQICKIANQIIAALTIEAVGEGIAVRVQGWRRPCQSAPGPDGWICFVSCSGGSRRAHDQAQIRAGISHRAASEGFEPCSFRCANTGHQFAQYRRRSGIVQLHASLTVAQGGQRGIGTGAGKTGES